MAGRPRSGSVKPKTINGRKVWIARLTWTDIDGERQQWKKQTDTKREANSAVVKKLDELDQRADLPLDAQRITLKQLGEHRKAVDLIEPEFDADGELRKGLHSWKDARRRVDFLLERFGPTTLIRAITYGDLKKYKNERLSEHVMITRCVRKPNGHRISVRTADGKKEWLKEATPAGLITLATVHRELTELRTMFELAKENGWLEMNPFHRGKKLIQTSKEKERDTIIDADDGAALLEAAADAEVSPHLHPFLVLAFDTGCRPIERTRLKVAHVDFVKPPANAELGTAAGSITLRSYKGGRLKPRPVPLTARLREILREWCAGKSPDEFVFAHATGPHKGKPIKSLKKSFDTAKRNAGIDPEFRLYDARHTTGTRLAAEGYPAALIGDFLGHTQPSTTKRYINPDHTARVHAAHILERYTGPRKPGPGIQDTGDAVN